jgi:hypothetical protein
VKRYVKEGSGKGHLSPWGPHRGNGGGPAFPVFLRDG